MPTITTEELVEALAAFEQHVEKAGASRVSRLAAMQAALEAVDNLRGQRAVTEALGQPDAEQDTHVIGEAIISRQTANGPVRCHARRCGDEMMCGRCGLTWSPGDEDPPACSPAERRASIRREGDR